MYLFKHLLLIIDLLKGKGHKYIKRVPVGVDKKTGRTRYRYVYNVTHKVQGKHIDDHDNMKVNSKYMWHSEKGEEVHVHVKKVNKDGSLVLMYDDGEKEGQEFTMSKKELAQKLREEHGIEEKFKEKREKVKRDLEMARKHGTDKQIKRLERELAGLSRKNIDSKKELSNTEKDDSTLESTEKQETRKEDVVEKSNILSRYEEFKSKLKQLRSKAKEAGQKGEDVYTYIQEAIDLGQSFKPFFTEFVEDLEKIQTSVNLFEGKNLYMKLKYLHAMDYYDLNSEQAEQNIKNFIEKHGSDTPKLFDMLYNEDENPLINEMFDNDEFTGHENPSTILEGVEKYLAVKVIDHLSDNVYNQGDFGLSSSQMDYLVKKWKSNFKKLKKFSEVRSYGDIDEAVKKLEEVGSTKKEESLESVLSGMNMKQLKEFRKKEFRSKLFSILNDESLSDAEKNKRAEELAENVGEKIDEAQKNRRTKVRKDLSSLFRYARFLQGKVSEQEQEEDFFLYNEKARKEFESVLSEIDFEEVDSILDFHEEEEEELETRSGRKLEGSVFSFGFYSDKDEFDSTLEDYREIVSFLKKYKKKSN